MKTAIRVLVCAATCLVLAFAGSFVSVYGQSISRGYPASIQKAHATSAMAGTKRLSASGWYKLDPQRGDFTRKGKFISCASIQKMKSGRGIKNGRLGTKDVQSMIYGKYYSGARKLKVAKRISYGKYTISGHSIGKLGEAKLLSRSGFAKAAKRKSVYWLLLQAKGGVVCKAYWMPLSSVEMLD